VSKQYTRHNTGCHSDKQVIIITLVYYSRKSEYN